LLQEYCQEYRKRYPDDFKKLFLDKEINWEKSIKKPNGEESKLLRDERSDTKKDETTNIIELIRNSLDEKQLTIDKLVEENNKLRSELNSIKESTHTISNEELKNMMFVKPNWKGRNFEIENDLCFLLMPFREPWSNSV